MTTLPGSGAISWSDIATMLGLGINDRNMNKFRAPIGSYRPGTDIPTTPNTTINANIFYNKTRSGCPQWVTRAGRSGNITRENITLDTSGNIYMTGYYNGTTSIYNADGSAFGTSLVSIGQDDMFIAKYNSSGDAQWVAKAGSSSHSERGNAIALDTSGNIYVTGTSNVGSMSFYNSDGTASGTSLPTGKGEYDVFLAKYNASGFFQWAIKMTSSFTEQGLGVAVDTSGNPYITGYYRGPMDLYNTDGITFASVSHFGTGSDDVFIAKYNSSGVLQWLRTAHAYGVSGTGVNERGYGVAIDTSNNVYLTGIFRYSTYFYTLSPSGSGSVTRISVTATSASTDMFVVKYNPSGTIQWIAKGGSTAADQANEIAIDTNNNIYVTGYYTGSSTFYNGNATGTGSAFGTLTQIGLQDIFIVKYNSSGTIQWIARAGGTSGNDNGNAITTDTSGNIYIAGYYNGTLTFYNANGTAFGTTLESDGLEDMFIAKYNSSGVVQWVARAGSTGNDRGHAITTDTSGNLYIAGFYNGTMTFYNAEGTAFSTTLSADGINAMFIAKYIG